MAELLRLQKYIALCGVCSRRAAEQMILEGKVRVGGKIVTELGTKINPDKDKVFVDGKPIREETKKYYIMLNKPTGYVTTAKDQFDRKPCLIWCRIWMHDCIRSDGLIMTARDFCF